MNYEENQEQMIEEGEPLSALQRVYKIFVSPGEVFRSINIKPNYWLPIIITVIFTFGFYLIFFSQIKDFLLQSMEEQMLNTGNTLPEEFMQKSVNISAITTVVLTPIITVVGMLLSALYYWVFGMILKGKGNYAKHFSLMANVGLVTLLSVVISAVLIVITGEFQMNEPITSLASLLPDSMTMTPLYGMLLKVEVFSIWRLVLIYFGLSEIGGLSKKKSLIIVSTAFVLGMLFSGGSIWFSTIMNKTL